MIFSIFSQKIRILESLRFCKVIFQTLCTKLGKVWQSQTVKSPFAPAALLILIQTQNVQNAFTISQQKGKRRRKLPSKSSQPQTAKQIGCNSPHINKFKRIENSNTFRIQMNHTSLFPKNIWNRQFCILQLPVVQSPEIRTQETDKKHSISAHFL